MHLLYICNGNSTIPAVGAANAENDKNEDKNLLMGIFARVPSYYRTLQKR